MLWYKVRDRLPAVNGYFLIFNGSDICIAWFQRTDAGRLKPMAFYDEFNQQLDITHWMSLPEPPCVHHNVEVKDLETY